ncbi:MAG: hypothetical protein ACOC8L_07215, partial [Spirochaetota bacterium]
MLRSLRRPLLVLGLFFALSGATFAADFTWTGGAATDDWQDAANWTLSAGVDDGANGFPDGTDRALFDSAVTPSVTNLPASLAELSISDAGANVTLGVGETLNTSSINVSAGTLTTGDNSLLVSSNVTIDGTLDASAQTGGEVIDANGNFTVSPAGNMVFGAGGLDVIGATSINNGANPITLTNPANNLGSSVLLTTTGNAEIVDASGLTLGTSNVGGNLTATAVTGNITDSGTVTVGGDATFTTSAGGADINLDTLAITGSVSLSTTGGGGNATIVNSGPLAFGASAVEGNLTATAGGAVTQAGALDVNGTTTVDAGAAPITLTNAGNDFTGAVALTTTGANDAAVVDTNALTLGASSLGGNLN